MLSDSSEDPSDPDHGAHDLEPWELEAARQSALASVLQLARAWPFEMAAYLSSKAHPDLDPQVAAVLEASLHAETNRRIALLELEFRN